jgi:hypothetical protein
MSLMLSLALLTSGDASYYAPGVFDRVAEYNIGRGKIQPCERCIGYVALLDAEDMGRLVWLDWGAVIDGPYLVADCAQEKHRQALAQRGRIVEVDYQTAMRHRMNGPIAVRVLWLPPEAACPLVGPC